MTANYDKLIAVLNEVFMLDKAELDFGIYKIMNQKRADIDQFLKNDLVPQVKTILAQNGSGDRKTLEKQLDEAIKQVQALGMDPENVPKVAELRAQLADVPDLTALENDVFSGLATFFKRYFDNGDFISMRRYKRDVYAIPYEGEEVKLHWANADQYYIKTAEYLKHYRFKLPGTELHVSFDLLEASTEQNNNKAQGDKERRFALCHDQPLTVSPLPNGEGQGGGVLHIYFTYEPTDKKRKQDDLLAEAFDTLKTQIPADFLTLLTLSPTEKNKNRTYLEKHLRDYTARNTFDYFIHKDLGGFLRREMDFYIKNEVLFLDDLDTTDDRIIIAQLAKVRALRQIGEKVITFLAQLEDFQKRLWLKKKFVVDSQYCITLDRIPKSFYAEIAQNEAQADEWVRLFAINEIGAMPESQTGSLLPTKAITNQSGLFDAPVVPYARPLTVAFLKQNPFLVLDTAFFSEDFKLSLLAELPNLDANTDGLLINSENFQALNLLQERYREQIKCVYIDPPYNTGNDGFAYKDSFQHSSWLAMLHDRLKLGHELMSNEANLFNSIDNREQERLKLVLSAVFDEENFVETFLWTKTSTPPALSSKSRKTVEYIHCYEKLLSNISYNGDDLDNGDAPLLNTGNPIRELAFPRNSIACNLPNGTYKSGLKEKVELTTDMVVLNGKVVNEVTLKGEFKWKQDTLNQEVKAGTTFIIKSEKLSIRFQRVDSEAFKAPNNFLRIELNKSEGVGTNETANKELEILGFTNFSYPKPTSLIEKLVKFNTVDDTILDYFAGSGTTGHAVINLNREDGGQRKYILVEMGEYFDTVTKPRILKVIYSKDWRDGKPVGRVGISHCLKYMRLESYEDTLNNLSLTRTPQQELALGQSGTFKEGYMLNYMLDIESRASLFNADRFRNPFAWYIETTRQNERTPTRVDLVETFNYLIGLVVEGQYRSGEHIRVVTGQTLASPLRPGEKTLIIWRNQDEIDNTALNEWLQKSGYNPRDREYDRIYVNGDNHLDNLRLDDDTWKVTLIEEAFRQLMG